MGIVKANIINKLCVFQMTPGMILKSAGKTWTLSEKTEIKYLTVMVDTNTN